MDAEMTKLLGGDLHDEAEKAGTFFWRFYGPVSKADFDEQAVDDLTKGRCVRSGNCCRKAPCMFGVALGETSGPCGFLRGAGEGEYSCALVNGERGPAVQAAVRSGVAIGEGCCSALNTDRLKAGKVLTIQRRARNVAQ